MYFIYYYCGAEQQSVNQNKSLEYEEKKKERTESKPTSQAVRPGTIDIIDSQTEQTNTNLAETCLTDYNPM